MLRALPAGYYKGDTLYCYFPAYDANGASLTISGLAVTDVECYKSGSTTQRASDNGIALLDTDGIDFDGSTGLHGFSIDTSDNSDSGFWADGSHYLIWVDAVTINAQTVRFGFEVVLGTVMRPATAGRKPVVDASGIMDACAVKVGPSGSGTAQTAGDIPARLPAALGANGNMKADVRDFSGTAGTFAAGIPAVNTTKVGGTTQTAGDLATLIIAATPPNGFPADFDLISLTDGMVNVNVVNVAGEPQTAGDIVATLGSPSDLGTGATLAANNSDIYGQTLNIDTVQSIALDIQATLGAAGAGLTVITAKTNLIPASPAAVGSLMGLADGAITDAKITFPAESAGRPTTFLAAMRRVWEWATNKRTRDRSTGTVLLRNAADSATLETQTQSTASTTDTQTQGS